MSHIRIGDD